MAGVRPVADGPGRVRRAVGGGHDPAVGPPTAGEWLEEWPAGKKKLHGAAVRSYARHIRCSQRSPAPPAGRLAASATKGAGR